MQKVSSGASGFSAKADDGVIELVQCGVRVGALLLEQRLGTLAGGAQLRYAAVAGGAVQAVNPFDQGAVVPSFAGLTNRFAVGFQRGQQHGSMSAARSCLPAASRKPSS